MVKELRQQEIMKLLYDNDRISVADLSLRFQVSKDTIRRDLTDLEDDGYLKRTHGGAIQNSGTALPLAAKKTKEHGPKYAVARKAAMLIKPDSMIAIDGGATNIFLASLIPSAMRLTVVTNCIPVVDELERKPNVTVILAGGKYNKYSQTTVGHMVIEQFREYYFDQCFVGIHAIDAKNGISSPHFYEDEITEKRFLIRHSKESNIMGLVSKLNRSENCVVCGISDVTRILVEHPVSEELNRRYQNKLC